MARLIAIACRLALVLASVITVAGIALIALAHPFLGVVLVGLAWWRKLHHRRVTDSYGSARVASVAEMGRGGLLAEDGVILGRCLPEAPSLAEGVGSLLNPTVKSDIAVRSFFAATYDDRWLSERLIRTNEHVHIATFSPAGGGKGIAAAIPNLLAHPGNWVIVDPKGELYRECARHRRKRFGKRIYRLDPFQVCGPGGDCLNPYQFIRPDADDFLDQCRDFAHPIIIRGKEEKQPHFNDMAELNLVALTAWVCGCQGDLERRHLGIVRGITSSRDLYNQAVQLMQQTDACQGVIKKLGGQIAFPADEEQASILSTFTRQMAFLDSPAVLRNVQRSSFDPMELKHGNADLFLILPAGRLQSLSRLQRLWITTVMSRVTGGVPDESRKIFWLLDEFAHIGSMPAIEEAVTLKRGMGVRLWFIFQSLGQLKTCFGDKAPEILDNIGTQQYFGINSYETAEELSKRIGDATIGIASVNDTSGQSHPTGPSANGPQPGSHSSSRSITHSEIARRLLKPEEILTLDKNVCIIFHKNLPVCLGRLVRFFDAKEFARGWFGFGARGTARPRPLGLAAAIMAALTLFGSTFVTAMALLLAGIVSPPPTALPGGIPAMQAGGVPMLPSAAPRPAPEGQRPAYAKSEPGFGKGQQARHLPQRRRRPGPSGFLIKIQ
jgi:type IV secretion system protein VirD4